jgi:hypothetical protein
MDPDDAMREAESFAAQLLKRAEQRAEQREGLKKGTIEDRIVALRAALEEEDPLGAVRELLVSEEAWAQQVVVWVYACILETNSAGLTIVLDCFGPPELETLAQALDSVGAAFTGGALRRLLADVKARVAAGEPWATASDHVHEAARDIRRAREEQLAEMNRCLFTYCEQHLEELAAG